MEACSGFIVSKGQDYFNLTGSKVIKWRNHQSLGLREDERSPVWNIL